MNKKINHIDPTTLYDHPAEVTASEKLSREEKIAVLKDWEQTIRLILVAKEENMQSGPEVDLHEVLEQLKKLEKPGNEVDLNPNITKT